jgi:oligopeptide/dipeptide ABC transporter ATP-binding protein
MSSLNPVLTIGRQLTEALVQHSLMDRKQAQVESVRLLDMVGITDAESRLGQYPHQFSGGMRQRVMMAMALSCSPSLIIADEPTTAVDVTIQAQLLEIIYSLTQRLQVAVLLITHNLGVVAKYAHKVNVMYAGRIVEQASAEELYRDPKHPYTQALLRSVPRLDRDKQMKLVPIEGQPPDLLDRPPGCAFHPRCFCALPQCRGVGPPLLAISEGHLVACPYGDGE